MFENLILGVNLYLFSLGLEFVRDVNFGPTLLDYISVVSMLCYSKRLETEKPEMQIWSEELTDG